MKTLGYLFILMAIFVGQAVARGRSDKITTDLSDGFLALIRGDTDALGEVLSRTGEGLTASQADLDKYEARTGMGDAPSAGMGSSSPGSIGKAAMARGDKAKGYRWTATGPDYYDCSGLMWRACQDAGVFTGPRFTTATVGGLKAFERVTAPQIDDLVVWVPLYKTGHMGVVVGDDKFYSARSRASGIGTSTISTWKGGVKPFYLRPRSRSVHEG